MTNVLGKALNHQLYRYMICYCLRYAWNLSCIVYEPCLFDVHGLSRSSLAGDFNEAKCAAEPSWGAADESQLRQGGWDEELKSQLRRKFKPFSMKK